MPGFWDDDEIRKAAEGGQYVKLTEVGDTVEGEIVNLRKRAFDDRTAIEITFDDDRMFTVGQVLLLRTMYELQPVNGETLRVVLADIEKRGTKTMKLFRVELTRLDGSVEKVDHTS